MEKAITKTKQVVRGIMREIAMLLNEISGGRITPNGVTLASLLLHLFIALAIINGQLVEAGVMLIIFGLLDTVDGELARLQGSESSAGMLYDFTADRVKEVIVYAALAYWLADNHGLEGAMLAVLALGAGMVTTAIKTKGETILRSKDSKIDTKKLNKVFSGGLMRFEVRMFVLVVALLSGYVYAGVAVVAVLSWLTATNQLFKVTQFLSKH